MQLTVLIVFIGPRHCEEHSTIAGVLVNNNNVSVWHARVPRLVAIVSTMTCDD